MKYQIDFWRPEEGHDRVQWQGSYEAAKQFAKEQLHLRKATRVQISESTEEMLFSLVADPVKRPA